ncbi:MAG: DUF1062 domain-containing protein [Ruminococcus sp.]
MNYTEKEYWIKAEKSFEILHACSGCKRKQSFVNTDCFRVNANGNRLDVWLIYQCSKCRHTLNVPIFERISPAKLNKELYEKFLENNAELAEQYGKSYSFFKSRKLEVDRNSVSIALYDENGKAEESDTGTTFKRIVVHNDSGLKLKNEKLIAMVLKISRSAAKKLIDENKISLRTESTTVIIEFI